MKTLREHQQAAARAPRGTKGKPKTGKALEACRANAAKATATRMANLAVRRWNGIEP
jgi:hypothetical protein